MNKLSNNRLFKEWCLPFIGKSLSEQEIKIAKRAFKLGLKNREPNAWLAVSDYDESKCMIVSSPIAPVGYRCLPIVVGE